ncbi:MAG: hypothetical protein IKT93_00975 [Clostridia bacterium]|nr:hypothetical protein [Clostridia bacterium]
MTKYGCIVVDGKECFTTYTDKEVRKAHLCFDYKQIDKRFIKDGFVVTFTHDCSSKRKHFDDYATAEKAMFDYIAMSGKKFNEKYF